MLNSHEFTVVADVYDIIEDDEGNEIPLLVKRNVGTKWYCRDLDSISDVEQILNERGKIRINYCKINTVSMGTAVVRMPYNEMKTLLNTKPKFIGYGSV